MPVGCFKRKAKKGDPGRELAQIRYGANNAKRKTADKGAAIVSRQRCLVHALYCPDLVEIQWDNFVAILKEERRRLRADTTTMVKGELSQCFKIEKKPSARQRAIEFHLKTSNGIATATRAIFVSSQTIKLFRQRKTLLKSSPSGVILRKTLMRLKMILT
jgi:hypothetical protein